MKIFKSVFCLLAVTLFGAALLPSARAADTWNEKTVVTFDQPVEVPGMILPAGTYMFKLADSLSDRNIVQIFNADGTHIFATILAINNYRLQPTGKTVMKFSEGAGDAPDALRAWFYPGDNFGQEFVYPKVRAVQLAGTSNVPVPAVTVDTLDDNTMRTAPIVAETPDQNEVPVNTVVASTPADANTASTGSATATPASTASDTPAPAEAAASAATAAPDAQTDQALPKTASSTPLIALFGALCIGLALSLGLISKFAS